MLRKKFKIAALFIAFLFSFSGLQAARYWVGNGGNWSDVGHWSTTSGGSGGASLPNELDVVIFDANSFNADGQTVEITNSIAIGGMDWSGAKYHPKLTGSASLKITLYGPAELAKEMTNEFLGSIDFMFEGTTGHLGNFKGNDFRGKWEYISATGSPYFAKKKTNTVLATITSITVTTNDAICSNEGWAKVSAVGGGIAPFTYNWGPGAYSGEPTDSIYGLSALNGMTVVVQDSEGDADVAIFNILGPNPTLFYIPTAPVNNSCYQSCNGSLRATGFGGTGVKTYSWTNGQAVQQATNLCAGGYTLTITDAAGCTTTYTDTVTEPTLLVASISAQTNVLCPGRSTGAATASVTGGTPGYAYFWYDAPGTPAIASISNVPAGTYNCRITDSKGCRDTATVIITQPTAITLTATTIQNLTCSSACIGQISYSGSGGTAPLTYSWYDIAGTPTTTPVSNLCAGTYNVEVTDGSGCKDTATTSVTQPAALVATIVAHTDVLCRGFCTGDATVSAAGGVAPYTYDWYNLFAQTTTVGSGMCAGASNVEVTDANGCKDTATIVITQPATTLFANIVSQTNNVCFGDCLGDAIVRSSGGTGVHTYNWYDTPGLETDTFASNLCANTYHVEVVDGNGCLDTASVSITEPTQVTGTFTDSIPLNCNGDDNGSLTVTPSGGTAGYTYLWAAPAVSVTIIASGLSAGVHSVQITDAIGCTGTATYTLQQPAVLTAAIATQDNVSCNGACDGQLIAGPAGGTAPYAYNWYTNGASTALSVTSLCPGTYSVEVTDANGCIDSVDATITQPAVLAASIASSTNLVCGSVCNGDATAAAAGGTAAYTYNWYDAAGQTTLQAVNLCGGTYNVEVTDANGCKDTAQVVIAAPVAVVASITTSNNVTCNGACNGNAIALGTGGVAPITYSWYDAPGTPATPNIASLCPGTYNVEVTDVSGCKDTVAIAITQPFALALNAGVPTNPTCFGQCTGVATVVPSGGSAPYTYNWYDAGGQTTATASNLCAGTYNVEVTDAGGCMDTLTFIITEPATALDITLVASTQATCNGICDGSATVVANGGTPGYVYSWYDVIGLPSAVTLNTLCFGTFHAEATDNNGCKDTVTVVITAPVVVAADITDSTNLTCNGVCIGDATVAAAGGTLPYTYNWTTAGNQSTAIATNLCSQLHTVTVTDASGCIDIDSVNITEPTPVVGIITDSSNISCNALCDGDATVDASGGNGPYTYLWYDVTGTPAAITVNALCGGTYHAEITDASGCLDTVSVNIIEPAVLIAAITKTDITCNGLCDGTMSALPSNGGTTPYTYNWYDTGGQTTISVSGLCAVTANVQVTDSNGCMDTATATILEPTDITSSVGASSIPTCVGVCNGSATAVPAGGTGPYNYNWYTSGNQITPNAVNMCSAIHYVEITDANGCLDTLTVPILAPVVVVATMVDSTVTACSSVCLGTATVSAVGGALPYTYNWFTAGNQNTTVASNLCVGINQVRVRDNNGCVDTASVVIGISSTPLVVTVIDSNGVSCFGDCDGDATIAATDGTAPYLYDWYTAGNQNGTIATVLCPGIHSVAVTDAVGCIDTASVVIISPIQIALNLSANNPVCNGDNNGTISSVPSGGTAPYTHHWSNGATGNVLVNLAPGTYIDTVSDANGCSVIDSVTLIDPVVVQTNAIATSVSCPGMTNAIAYATPSGGTGPFTFLWSTLSVNDSITGLGTGVYTVTVTDSVGCSDFSSVSVTAPAALALSVSHNDAVCICNGDATVAVGGGTAPYAYLWNDLSAQTVANAVNLCAGVYRVRVTDSLGCKDSIPVNVLNTSTLTGNVINSIPTTCFTTCDGSGMVAGSLGQAPYSYLWNDIAATANDTANNLCAGSYIVQVTDANSCIYNIIATITSPPAVSGVSSVIMPLCFGDCNGTATLVPSGGSGGPYTHSWDTGSSNDSIFNLCAATYNDTVKDAAGCTGIVSVVVNQPTILIATPAKTNVTCNGAGNGTANANASGGTTPYSYLWDNAGASTTATLSGLVPGTYRVTVSDANGCTYLDSVTITEPLPLTSFIVDSTTVNCNCVGLATIRGNGGTLPYTFLWNDPAAQTDSTAIALCAGIYTGAVIDANGCISASPVHIVDISGFSASITSTTDLKCNAVCIGSASITAVGGTLPYTYAWNDPAAQTTATANNLCAGNLTGIVTDQAGCRFILPTTITQPTAIVISVVTTNVSCSGLCDGKLLATVSGGTGSTYTYSWNDPLNQNTLLADSLCPAIYVLTVNDSVGCVKTFTRSISEPLPLIAFISAVSNVSCNGNCNGSINSIGVAGTAPYTYSWSSGPTTKNISGLCPATYTLTVTDAHGCIDDSAQVITQPAVLNAFLVDSTLISCNSVCDGIATAGASGGTSPYAYSWYDFPGGQNTAAATNLCAQTYHAKITDANGCMDTTQVKFIPPAALDLILISKTAAKCNGDCNGTAVVLGSGGTGALTYSWVGAQTGPNPTTLCAGNNTVTLKDANNCTKTLGVVIAEPTLPLSVLIIDTVHLLCASIWDGEATASASGGNAGGYTYLWDDPLAQTTNKATGLRDGIFNVTATDSKGCQANAPVTINTTNAFSVTIVPTNILCYGDCNGVLKVVTTGGVGTSSVSWTGPGVTIANKTLKTLNNRCTGNYTVTAIDQSTTGCQQSKPHFLSDPPLLVPVIGSDSTNLLCNGICSGTATAVGQGGTPGYTYKWNDPASQTTAKAVGLCAGQHKVDVTDANGCVKPAYVNLTQPTPMVYMNTTTKALCTNTNEGSIDETVAGGVTPYSYAWTGPNGFTSNIQDPANLYPGQYILTLRDNNFCQKKDTAIVTEVTFIFANAGADTTICNSDTVYLNGSGGLTYAWNTGETTASIIDQPSVTTPYYLTVKSAGCTDKDTVVVTVNPTPTADISMANSIILEGSSQILFGSGAGPGGTYDWLPPTSLNDPTLQNPTATPLKTTVYYLTVTNTAGCSDSTSALLKVAKGIVFPDGITPNGDGKNDTWVIDLIDQFPQCKVEIFNRWGQQVFQSAGYTKNWDGTYNHIPLPVGTYYYIIDLGPGMQKYTGPITVMR